MGNASNRWPFTRDDLIELTRGQQEDWAWSQRVNDAQAKLLLVALARRVDSHGYCRPGQQRLTQDTEQSERTIKRALAKLVELGLVWTQRRIVNGVCRGNEYVLACNASNVLVSDAQPSDQRTCQYGPSNGFITNSSMQGTTSSTSTSTHSSSLNNERLFAKDQPFQADFDRWWALYPRKTGKQRAFKRYQAVRRAKHDARELELAAQHLASVGRPTHAVPYPATFLADETWVDWVSGPPAGEMRPRNGAAKVHGRNSGEVSAGYSRKGEVPDEW